MILGRLASLARDSWLSRTAETRPRLDLTLTVSEWQGTSIAVKEFQPWK